MKIYFHGAARTVTGSQHLVEVNGHRLLLECGLYQGKRRETYERNLNFPFDHKSIDAVILSHAHIDHSGNLPNLAKKGYEGPVFATEATAHLAEIMLRDSGHIHESDARYVNKKRLRRGEPPIEPLYTIEDAARVQGLLREVSYESPFEPVPGVMARFYEAGHILGSAGVCLDIEESGRQTRLWFSGDIGRAELPLIRDPVLPREADLLIMESTYGDRLHKGIDAAYEKLQRVVKRTVDRGGKVIVPAFAVGRTQELVYCLHRMIDSGDIPRIPVFVDSPLAVNVTDIFRAHPECFDEAAREFIDMDHAHQAALGFDLLTYVRSVEESKALNRRHDPMVIISASGMAETGRILHHLKNNIEDARNTVLIVSWQAPHTLGRRLVERVKRVKIFGEVYRRRAEVETINGFSAHADQAGLVEYAEAVKDRVRQVFLVHGERRAAEPLMEKLGEAGIGRVSYPKWQSSVEV
jgi:metallo-beta-lactamase family protein